ncbi:sulfotransferase domain-containing protein [Erythrobacter sp. HKB08]|uniref:sulfotransferase domain-containing protein n=1 Tax=Erythrobacter sp. HKB08 TaxID=2502843 RepID=UPI0013E8DC84|nr:sulfotransferase domain-containing protein [Erythrobacter sp. HKB08]
MTAQLGPGRSIVWLASYPKSGSTWVRALLTACLFPDEPLDLSALVGGPIVFDRSLLDDHAAIDSADLTLDALLPYQSAFHRAFAAEGDGPVLVKTHSAFRRASDGTALFPKQASAGAILIVRNPLDIVASYAHHEGKTADAIIERMADEEARQDEWPDKTSKAVPQLLGSWSTNVTSWLDQDEIPLLLVRYEDLLSDPAGQLDRITSFCGLSIDLEKQGAATDAASFERLKKAEDDAGFSEKPRAGKAFFRKGRTGGSTRELNEAQNRRILEDHGAAMRRLGYSG